MAGTGLNAAKAADALAFHHAICGAVAEHLADAAHRDRGSRVKPVAGNFQPTSQSARLSDGDVELLRSYRGQD